jgi:hypothetical protein
MVGVVEADGDEIADAGERHAEPRLAGDRGQIVDVGARQPGLAFGRDQIGGDVVDDAGEIADIALAVENARLFLPGRAVA